MEYAPNSLQDQLNKQKTDIITLTDELREIKRLLIGNEVTGEKGLVAKLDELMEFVAFIKAILAGGNYATKAILWTLTGIGGVAGFSYTLFKFIKEITHN